MPLTWEREPRPVWDADKERIIGGAPEGALDVSYPDGAELPGDWFVAAEDGKPVGYGWMDSTWGGDTEILLAVDTAQQGRGVGSFVMTHLEWEAAQRGINYVYNTVRETHPDRDQVHDWLLVRGYRGNERDASLRKRVAVEDTSEPAAPKQPQPELTAVPPGHEDRGGYVNIEDHQY
ncbi:MAG TPA: GNAT family N-acetyltransferase [Segeticoccus sp.]|uniref:GNAT family N-acetyltransferase n=1 Tax=Segeticoccus sp. TaxID=2706531 RepID=UPI002D80F671|nr:GNAT family N-acetyltransferase [Segeticoccus sp.]HET8599132.1 GNAT family N-acetyltransferase [Segeticoccus sp.]